MFNRIVERQPVWDWVAARQPDHLVLLGDSFYLDLQIGGRHPQDMLPMEFAEHLQTLYGELIAQREFAALVRALPAGHVHAIWDDHDFLWNDACGAEVRSTHRYDAHLQLTTSFMEQFRRSLAGRLERFEPPPADATAPLGTPTLRLAPDVHLHLSDGRTFRTRTHLLAESRRSLFGADQRQAFAQRIGGAPDALHLWASGSTIAGYQRYERDLAWLRSLAAQQRMLVLSGDIHRNAFDSFQTGGRFMLHEATSSGAAIKDAVVFGQKRQNFGLLEIDDTNVTVELYKDNAVESRHVIERGGWKPT
jgi:alkaline phosphatase D